jgi:alkanesulfonate monooxygenase SsuD/methylene tetrahydromethanopterin reductase-like flavin-dependent oxidoreductase (luciferase family)
MTGLGFMVRTGTAESVVRAAARMSEEAGYQSLWINNPPGEDGLTPAAWAAGATSRISLGTGVVPISEHPPAEILNRMAGLDLPRERYRLGIGSGFGAQPRRRVRDALVALRPAGYELVVGALGPSMCRLAGEAADGVLLVTVTPGYARRSAELARSAAEEARRPPPRVSALLLVGIGAAARARMEGEVAFLAGLPQYAAHFERMGVGPADTLVAARDASELSGRLAAWREVVDELVLTSVPAPDRPDGVLELVEPFRGAWEASADRVP